MTKHLQILLLFIFLIQFPLLGFSQESRIKTFQTENYNHNINSQESYENTVEQKNVPKNKVENVVNKMQLRDTSTVSAKAKKNTYPNTENEKVQVNDHVRYEKISFPEQNINQVSEKKKAAVNVSVNYKAKTIREDIHPQMEYNSNKIAPEKLQLMKQEAQELEMEIKENKKNAKYDLIEKQKKLDYIKSLINNNED